MDAIQLLINDHNKVKGIFQQFEQGGNSQEFNQLFIQLYQDLSVHALAEEAVLYPALAAFPEFSEEVKEAFKEQAEVKALFGELAALDNTTQEWSTKITTLMKDVQDHVQMEETDLFPKARQKFTAEQLNSLGDELQKAKQLITPGVVASVPMKEAQGQAGMLFGTTTDTTNQYAQ